MGTKRIYEVLADIDGQGPAGDGTAIRRFRTEKEAQAFADRSTCYGRPAEFVYGTVPVALARRWGLA